MVSFKELFRRLQIQDQMNKQHQTRVDVSKKHPLMQPVFFSPKDMGSVPSDYQQRNLKQMLWCQGRSPQMSYS